MKRFRTPSKFKLFSLDSDLNIRYDVVYKNLLRDFRRYFYNDFNNKTLFIKRKRRQKKSKLNTCIASYLESTGIGEALEQKGLNMESISFVFGALIYPKHMLAIYEPHLRASDGGESKIFKELDSRALR